MKSDGQPPACRTAAMLGCFLTLAVPVNAAEPPAAVTANKQVSDTRMVIVEGVGPDVETARKDAYRAAVRQVLGALVDSETLVENDQLVTDKVVVFSDGFVEKVEDVPNGVSEENGFVRLRVKALVKAGKLADSLRANAIAPAGSAVTVTDPRSAFAQALTEQERKANARDLFLAAAAGYPANCFVAEVGQPKILEVKDGIAHCEVRVKISVDQNAYDEFTGRLVAFLESGEIEAQGRFNVWEEKHHNITPGFLQSFLPKPHADRLGATFDRQGKSSSLQVRLFEWPPSLFQGGFGTTRSGEPYKALERFRERADRPNPLIFLQTGSGRAVSGRWFLVDPHVTPLPLAADEDNLMDLKIANEMNCRVEVRDADILLVAEAIKLHNFGHAANPGRIGSFPAVYFAPGLTLGRIMGSSLEFTLPIAVPEAAFHKPRLTITVTLSNVPTGKPKK